MRVKGDGTVVHNDLWWWGVGPRPLTWLAWFRLVPLGSAWFRIGSVVIAVGGGLVGTRVGNGGNLIGTQEGGKVSVGGGPNQSIVALHFLILACV